MPDEKVMAYNSSYPSNSSCQVKLLASINYALTTLSVVALNL